MADSRNNVEAKRVERGISDYILITELLRSDTESCLERQTNLQYLKFDVRNAVEVEMNRESQTGSALVAKIGSTCVQFGQQKHIA